MTFRLVATGYSPTIADPRKKLCGKCQDALNRDPKRGAVLGGTIAENISAIFPNETQLPDGSVCVGYCDKATE